MKAYPVPLSLSLSISLVLAAFSASAGQFKRIAIDGAFTDWAGVAPAVVDPEDVAGSMDYKEIYLANDDQYLYVRVRFFRAAAYGDFHHHVLIDADADPATGNVRLGVGSELMIEDGNGFQQKNGGFNEGNASQLDWAEAPTGSVAEYEARISRDVRDAEGELVFRQNNVVLAFEILDRNWATQDVAPDTGGVAYEFAPTPGKATGSRTLISLDSTSWRYQDGGIDLATDWLAPDYDDAPAGWKSGVGLFGYGVSAGTYPAAIQTPLTTGHPTYYFRVPFTWDYDSHGVALAMESYLSDGAVYYLNGVEVKRVRLPDGPVTFSTAATGGPASAGKAESTTLPPEALVVGNNVLEVEVHQAIASPGELAFGLKLTATDSLPPSLEDPAQPADRQVVEGAATVFSPGHVLGTVPFTYQWFKDGAPLPDATNENLSLPVVLVSDAGAYRVEIANRTGSKATSRTALLTTTAVPVVFTNAAEPVDRGVTEGESTTFSAGITGSPTLFYQWFKDGQPIEGATADMLVLSTVALGDAGLYTLTVSNRLNAATSRSARLTVARDLVAPALASVVGSAGRVTVRFTEPVDAASAGAASHYTLTGGAAVRSAVVDAADPTQVALTTDALSFGQVYTLTVQGVQDRYGNAGRATAQFRATIAIDGDFGDWTGIVPATSETQDTEDGKEFKEISVANDDDYLYLRFSFYANVGQLPVDAYFHIYFDADNDPATGLPTAGIGSEMMIENGSGYQQKGGQFNEGVVRDLDFVLAPAAASSEFECRISRRAVFENDGLAVFSGSQIALALQLVNSNWAVVDTAPQSGGIPFTFAALPPMNLSPLRVSLSGGKVQITWTGSGVLEATENLGGGGWTPVANASSPYTVSPTATQRFFRLRL